MSIALIPIEVVAVFFSAAIALALAPGPDNIFVLTQSALHGRMAGLIVTFGLCIGLLVHTAAVALGVAAVFAASATAFTALKLIGAAYLVYLAWHAFRASTASLCGDREPPKTPLRLLGRGVIMNVTNPKVAIFFLAFLPQFTDPALGPIRAQMLVLGAIFIFATFLVFGAVAVFSGIVGEKIRRSAGFQKALNIVAGVVFVGLAARLALTER